MSAALLLAWASYEPLRLIIGASKESVIIESCHEGLRRVGRRGRSVERAWGPIATAKGTEIKGKLIWPKKSLCRAEIGKQVTVYVDPADPSKSQFYSFEGMWRNTFGAGLFFLFMCWRFVSRGKLVRK